MSEQWVIDPLVFASKHASMSGELPLSQLRRLAAELASDAGSVAVTLRGTSDAAGRPLIEVELGCRLSLTCQRCLESYEFALDRLARFRFVRTQAELPGIESEDPDIDCLVAEPRTDVRSLIEDEILLCLPIAPMHAEGDCSISAGIEAASAPDDSGSRPDLD